MHMRRVVSAACSTHESAEFERSEADDDGLESARRREPSSRDRCDNCDIEAVRPPWERGQELEEPPGSEQTGQSSE